MTAKAKVREQTVNGLSVGALFDAANAINETHSLGRCQFRAHNQWLDGGHTRTTVKDFFAAGAEQTSRTTPLVVESDLPPHLRGGDGAMSSLELLLAAIGACMTTTVAWHAAARGVHLNAIDTRLEGDIDLHGWFGIDSQGAPGFNEIRLSVQLDAEAPDETLDQLVELATQCSPLFDTMTRGTRLKVQRAK
jgi:uncharacterized OsmC-like protein